MNQPKGLTAGTHQYRMAVAALLCAGLATFNSLYTTQALMPRLVQEFSVSPSLAALTLSAATGALSLAVVPASVLSEKIGRGRMLVGSAILATVVGLMVPLATSISMLIVLRALQGVFIAGVPAVAMTWLSEEITPKDLTKAMGLYIAGTSVGGISGRLIPSVALTWVSWQTALVLSATFALLAAVLMAVLLPAQRNFTPHRVTFTGEFRAMLTHLRTLPLLLMFASAFLCMGVFVSLYNFVGFRLIHHFGLDDAHVGLLFLLYLFGTLSSTLAGRANSRFGHGITATAGSILMVIGLALTMGSIISLTMGLVIFTAAFFLVHSTASAAVGLLALTHRAEAASMYVFNYYMGSSILGWVSSFIFDAFSWYGFTAWLMGWTTLLVGCCIATLILWPKPTR
ncbi:MAG: MFS transporter [Corynebacterium sp.]|uniref:MFS transporter n=1 Tax=Corynebacterium sp. TaxID=1720 RepID=UPI0026DC96A5|nr:MFS transporter [Corynebacterium sp.]MDO4761926.1 MFS transporter [Corynebacterium sp.]